MVDGQGTAYHPLLPEEAPCTPVAFLIHCIAVAVVVAAVDA